MRKLLLFCAATTMLLAGAVAWTTSSHSAVKAVIESPIDPFSLMVNAKNLPSQESLNAKMWPDKGVVHY